MHRAAEAEDLPAVEKWLAAKYRVSRFDALGKTPLHHAVARNHLLVVNCLIQAGANVNAHDERLIGNTPLSDSIEKMSVEMAHRLIEAGADPTIRGGMQLNALDRAAQRSDSYAKNILRLLQNAVINRKT